MRGRRDRGRNYTLRLSLCKRQESPATAPLCIDTLAERSLSTARHWEDLPQRSAWQGLAECSEHVCKKYEIGVEKHGHAASTPHQFIHVYVRTCDAWAGLSFPRQAVPGAGGYEGAVPSGANPERPSPPQSFIIMNQPYHQTA